MLTLEGCNDGLRGITYPPKTTQRLPGVPGRVMMTRVETRPLRPSVIEVDELLDPIEDDNPSGRPLIYEGAYDRIRQARLSEDDAHLGDWQRETKVARWDEVIAQGKA